MAKTGIPWTEATWNPTTGCSKVSPGCAHCYAERMAKRLRGRHGYPAEEPFRVTLHPERLDQPLRWRKPRQVFVDSMGDLFHEDVPDEFIGEVFDVAHKTWRRHIFQMLTKRPERMLQWANGWYAGQRWTTNVWAGVSVELQKYTHRIGTLLQVPAALRFVSLEPLLGPVDPTTVAYSPRPGTVIQGTVLGTEGRSFSPCGADGRGLDWVIVGCESKGGHLGRLSVDGKATEDDWWGWVVDIRDQCVAAGVALFLKQGPVNGKLVREPELDGRQWLQKPGPSQ